MNSLDSKLVSEIICFLKLTDRIKMRLVAKRYKQIVDTNFPVKHLVLTPNYDFYNRWRGVFVCVDYRSSVLSSLNLSVPTPALTNLMRLKVKLQLRYDDLKRLQTFQTLVQLEVGLLEIGQNAECIKLNSLKSLYVAEVNHEERGFITIDSPHLINVYFGTSAINYIKLVDYQTVNWLEFCGDKFGSCLEYTNCRVVVCNQILDLEKTALAILAKQPELRALHCNVRLMECADDKPLKSEAMLKQLREVYDLLMGLRDEVDSQTNFFIHEVVICKARPFGKYKFTRSLLNLHVHNAHHTLTEKSPSVESISYSNFLRSVVGLSRTIVLMRYLNIQKVDLFAGPKKFKFKKLRGFLSLCKHIRSLLICYLDIKFEELDQLPSLKSLAMLSNLQLIHHQRTDLSFLSRFDFLDRLKTNLVNVEGIHILKSLNPNGVYEFFVDGDNSIVVKKHTRPNSYDLTLVPCSGSNRETHLDVTIGGLTEILYRTNGLFQRSHWLDRGDTTVPPTLDARSFSGLKSTM